MAQTVVITGASAGIGRATARLFGERGARVGLLARGHAGLDGAVKDVEHAGGQGTRRAHRRGRLRRGQRCGPPGRGCLRAHRRVDQRGLHVGVRPFWQIEPDEFKRVTEVSYLGYVYGTRIALDLMRPRDHGTIVQVGSALSLRSIPLQSAYCGAKHAINGFTSSLRTELLHEGSNVQVTVAQMPAVNTPQFSWVLSRLPNHPQPVPPIYQPEVAARGVLYAADHPGRKQYWVGDSTAAPSWPTSSPLPSSTVTWPVPASGPSRRTRRSSPTIRTTCGSPSTAKAAKTTARTGRSMTGPTASAPNCGSPSTPERRQRSPLWPWALSAQ